MKPDTLKSLLLAIIIAYLAIVPSIFAAYVLKGTEALVFVLFHCAVVSLFAVMTVPK